MNDIVDIYESYLNGNFDQMYNQIKSYKTGIYACFCDLNDYIKRIGFIENWNYDNDFKKIVLMYFKKMEY